MAGLALKPLIDKRKVALAKARFRAWWEGEDFDEAAFLASLEAEPANDPGVEKELFEEAEPSLSPRLKALGMLWGLGRIMPGLAETDALEPARMGAERGAVLAVFGPGLPGPLIAIAQAFPGRLEAFEWREETVEELADGVRRANFDDRISVTRIDLEAHVWQPEMFDGIWCLDDFTYVGYAPHLAQQIFKSLKEGACAVVEAYVGFPGDHIQPAFATAFAEPQVRAHGDLLKVFADSGLTLDRDEDVTADHLALARLGFRDLRTVLADSHGLDPQTGREIAWEAQAWAARMKLMNQGRLHRRRFTLRKDTLPPQEPEIEVRAREALQAALHASKTNAP